MKRLPLMFLAFFVSASAQIEITREGGVGFHCVDGNDEILSSHAQEYKAIEACQNRLLNDPGGAYSVLSNGRIRLSFNAAEAQGLIAIDEYTRPPTEPPATTFNSDVVIHADIGTVLGNGIDTAYQDAQVVRALAWWVNLDYTLSFDLSGSTTVYYAHVVPTNNNHTTEKPCWLTAGSGWSFTGDSWTTTVPDPYTAAGTQTADVFLWSNPGETGVSVAGFRACSWENALGHYVGAFLIPSGITISNLSTELLAVIADASDAYSPPAKDEYFWDVTPPGSYGVATTTSTDWADFETDIEAASCGDEIELPDGTYNNQGLITINGVSCDFDGLGPVVARPATPGGATLSGTTRVTFDTSSGILFEGFNFNGGAASDGDSLIRIQNSSSHIVIRNNKFQNLDSTDNAMFGVRADEGQYLRFHNNDVASWYDCRQGVRFNAPNTDPPMWSRIDHNDLTNYDLGTCTSPEPTGQAEGFAAGNQGTADPSPPHNSMFDHNRIFDWNMPNETEAITNKGGGWAIMNNWLVDSNGGLSIRFACDGLIGFNVIDNDTNQNNRNNFGLLNACGEDRTDSVYVGNYTNFQSDGVGLYGPNKTTTTSSSRIAAKRVLFVGDLMVTGDDDYMSLREESGATLHASDLRWECTVAETAASTVVDDSRYGIQGDWQFSGNVWYSTTGSLGTTNPGGVTEEDPVFADRGDGIQIPGHASIDCGINTAWPGRIEGSISDLGPTW